MYRTATTTLGLAMAFICCATASAATPPESGDKVDLTYDVLSRENVVKAFPTGTCPVHIVPTVDARQNKETIGAAINTPLLADNVGPWVTDGLGHLKDFGYAVSEVADGAPIPADGVTVRTSVTRAFTWQIGFKLFSMVAVKAEFVDRNGAVLQKKYYRAHGDKTNIWGANAEYVTTLNYGLNNMLPFIARDLQSLCKGEKVEEYTYAGPEGLPQK